jgi:hypothetical protein
MPDPIAQHDSYIDRLAQQVRARQACDYELIIGDGWWCECTVHIVPRGYKVTIQDAHWRGDPVRRGLEKLLAEIPDAANVVAIKGRYEISEVIARAEATA